MKIIFSIFLTFSLVSCDEIRLQIGGDDVGEVREWVWMPQPDSPVVFANSVIDHLRNAYLVNTRTGDVQFCTSNESQVMDCTYAASGTKTDQQLLDRNLLNVQ